MTETIGIKTAQDSTRSMSGKRLLEEVPWLYALGIIHEEMRTASTKEDLKRSQNTFEKVVLEMKSADRTRFRCFQYYVSPSEQNHLLILNENCWFFNLYGSRLLMKSNLFCEGEAYVDHVRWIEKDHLVTFDVKYPVHFSKQPYAYHFSNDADAFLIADREISAEDKSYTEQESDLHPIIWDVV